MPRAPAKKEKGCDSCKHRACLPVEGGLMHKLLYLQGPKLCIQEEYSEGQGHITDTCNNKGLAAGVSVFRVSVPKPDQEITAKTNPFPPEIEEEQVVGQYQRKH